MQTEEALIERGWWVRNVTAGPGVVVMNARYVAFIPTERPKSVVAEIAKGSAGIVTIGATKISPEQIIDQLAAGPLDERVRALTAGSSGHIWEPRSVKVQIKKILLRPKRRRLWFGRGGESIRLHRAVLQDEIERIRSRWPDWTYD